VTVLHVITGLDNGGAEGALFRLACADRANAHIVISMTSAGVYGPRLGEAGITVHTAGMPRGRVTLAGLRRILGIMRSVRADVVQTWMYHADLIGGTLARIAGRRAVAWGVRAADAHLYTPGAANALVRICAAASHVIPRRIVFNSAAGARWHRRAGYSASRSRVVPNGYDTTTLRRDASARERQRAAWGVPQGAVVIGTVARWDPLKDHATLAAAYRALITSDVPWMAVLVGPGMRLANREAAALFETPELAPRVRLVGPSDDIPAVMNALDLHLLSSRSEAFPNVLAEAMACGTPCVTTDAGDAGTIVGTTGWVVPPGDAPTLVKAIAAALGEMGDGASWERRRLACRAAVVERYSMDAMVSAYHRVWREAIES
jgi:glycosyltransferase involved in cell wall biosynthesis